MRIAMAFGCVIFLLLGGDTTWKIVAAFDRTGNSVSFVGTEHDNALILSQCSSQRVHPGAAPLRLRGGKPRGWRGMKRYRKNLLPVPSNREWRRQQLEWEQQGSDDDDDDDDTMNDAAAVRAALSSSESVDESASGPEDEEEAGADAEEEDSLVFSDRGGEDDAQENEEEEDDDDEQDTEETGDDASGEEEDEKVWGTGAGESEDDVENPIAQHQVEEEEAEDELDSSEDLVGNRTRAFDLNRPRDSSGRSGAASKAAVDIDNKSRNVRRSTDAEGNIKCKRLRTG